MEENILYLLKKFLFKASLSLYFFKINLDAIFTISLMYLSYNISLDISHWRAVINIGMFNLVQQMHVEGII